MCMCGVVGVFCVCGEECFLGVGFVCCVCVVCVWGMGGGCVLMCV